MYMKRKDWDIDDISRQLRAIHRQAASPHNDGFTAVGCKQDLFQLKCLIEDLYQDTPPFSGEEQWHEQRTLDLLKRQHKKS
jgi:hypothetical protein